MPDNYTALIPLTPEVIGLDPAHRNFQLSVFTERRQRALGELRMLTGVPELARDLKPDQIYRLIVPHGKILQKGKDGLFSGVFHGANGEITQHAKFQKVSPNLAQMASAVGSQILLVSIAMQLNRVEEAIAAISEELNNDRIAEILAGEQQFEMAMHMKDRVRRDAAVQHAIQSLTEGLVKVTLDLRTRIRDLPDPTNTFCDNWGGSKAQRAASEFRIAEDAFKAAVRGASVLAECYAVLEEPKAGAAAITRSLENIESCGVQTAADKARLVEVRDPKCLPENIWLRFNETRMAYIRTTQQVSLDADAVERGSVAVDFKACELVEKL